MRFRERFNRLVATLGIAGTMFAGAEKEVNANPLARLEAVATEHERARSTREQENPENSTSPEELPPPLRQELRDQQMNGLAIASEGDRNFFVNEDDREVILQDALGHVIHPTEDPGRFFIEIDGQQFFGNQLTTTSIGIVFEPEGYNVVITPNGVELHEEGRSYDQSFGPEDFDLSQTQSGPRPTIKL